MPAGAEVCLRSPIEMVADPLMALSSLRRYSQGRLAWARLFRLGVLAGTFSLSLFFLRRERLLIAVSRQVPTMAEPELATVSDELGLDPPSGGFATYVPDADSLASRLSPYATVATAGSVNYTAASKLRNSAMQTLPALVVYPRCAEDVEAAVNFARLRRLRVTVFGTGHEYDGRSVGEGSLNINTRDMRWAHFVDKDLMSVGPGMTWREVYEASLVRGMVPLSGYDSSVGVVGFTLGGGHGPLSRRYGLGADHLVAATVVDASGKAKEARGDWLWALRGGGGGTFGVVVNMTLRLMPAPVKLTQLSYGLRITDRRPELLLRYFHNASFWRTLPRNWANWNQLVCSNVDSEVWMMGLFLHASDEDNDDNALAHEPMSGLYESMLAQARVDSTSRLDVDIFDNIMDFERTFGSIPLGRYRRQFIGNVFLSADHLEGDKATRFTDYAMDSMVSACRRGRRELFIYYNNVLGGNVPERAGPETSVSQAFRDAVFEVGPNAYWDDPDIDAAIIETSAAIARGLNALSDSSYLNEWSSTRGANVMIDWQKRFWGENYARLLDVKHAVDPCNMFWVPHGVGSDETVYARQACDDLQPAFS